MCVRAPATRVRHPRSAHQHISTSVTTDGTLLSAVLTMPVPLSVVKTVVEFLVPERVYKDAVRVRRAASSRDAKKNAFGTIARGLVVSTLR